MTNRQMNARVRSTASRIRLELVFGKSSSREIAITCSVHGSTSPKLRQHARMTTAQFTIYNLCDTAAKTRSREIRVPWQGTSQPIDRPTDFDGVHCARSPFRDDPGPRGPSAGSGERL